ncbi:SMI1/KNR4 family protein [Paenibacillus sp. JX-17]|uniref:SMI1/KNR4 family protein n=1 Tax=Paenibacillus lacisoli TaxID=3064525 RepID=A0ABT9CHR5_9BACL|nr:SMI1/KNR4 family protein [Paenibacillus sp. JX-17]MDO7908824.1 SMI1/KNR4 family protein [Paenibacillus sp. JX-17]
MPKQRFEQVHIQREGADAAELSSFLKNWNDPLTENEIKEAVERRNQMKIPILDEAVSLWTFPQRDLPHSYIEFLQYSNGGEFQTGERYFQLFSTSELREYNLLYEFPEYMKGSVSIGMDGCGNHYIVDMREEPVNGEYPIRTAHSGCLDYEESVKVAESFEELCKGRSSMDDEKDRLWE